VQTGVKGKPVGGGAIEVQVKDQARSPMTPERGRLPPTIVVVHFDIPFSSSYYYNDIIGIMKIIIIIIGNIILFL